MMVTPVVHPQLSAPRLRVAVNDALQRVTHPSVSPLAQADVNPATGPFVLEDILPPATGYVVVVVADDPVLGVDEHYRSGVTFEWVSAGCVAGLSRGGCGVMVAVFTAPPFPGGELSEGGQLLTETPTLPVLAPLEQTFFPRSILESFMNPTSEAQAASLRTGAVLHAPAEVGSYSARCAPGSPCELAAWRWGPQVAGGRAYHYLVTVAVGDPPFE